MQECKIDEFRVNVIINKYQIISICMACDGLVDVPCLEVYPVDFTVLVICLVNVIVCEAVIVDYQFQIFFIIIDIFEFSDCLFYILGSVHIIDAGDIN